MIHLTPSQIEAIARAYCQNREQQDGGQRSWRDHVEIAQILHAWYAAFASVLGPPREMVEGDL